MENHKKILVPSILVLSIFILEMATDIYLPSLPEMQSFFGVSSALIKGTISAYLLGFGLLGFISGPLSDSFGRRPVTIFGMFIFALASFLAWWCNDIYALIGCRFLQGIGAGIICVLSTATIKDLFDDVKCSRILSSMGMIIALAPLLAPILGGMIAEKWGWNANFFLIALVGFLPFVFGVTVLPESLPPIHRQRFSWRMVVRQYQAILSTKVCLAFSLISGITYGSLWIWIAQSPFYLIETLSVPPHLYGFYTALGPLAYIFGSLLNRRFVGRYSLFQSMRIGLFFMILGALLFVVVAFVAPFSLMWIMISLIVYGLGLAPVFANAATLSVDVVSSQRGTASGLLTTVELICAGLCTLFVSEINSNSLVFTSGSILVCCVLCYGLYMYINTLKKQKDLSGIGLK